MSKLDGNGYLIALTADRSLMSAYPSLLDGMFSASQTTAAPEWLWRSLMAPALSSSDDQRAPTAPLGLRRIEAALLSAGFTPDDIIIVPPELLDSVVGERTKIIGASAGDPLGIGMNSGTMAALMGGSNICGVQFRKLAKRIAAMRATGRAPNARFIVGGPGAWQLAGRPDDSASLGVDIVVSGYAESSVGDIFRRVIDGGPTERVYDCSTAPVDDPPAVRGATSMGVVEISRGCGLGCEFCSLRSIPMRHLPVDLIVRDIETNQTGGIKNISLISEDFFRYGASGPLGNVAPDAIKELLKTIRKLPNIGLIQTDHANIASIDAISDPDLKEIHDLLAGESGAGCLWINVGVETPDEDLLRRNGGQAKMRPFGTGTWADACRTQMLRLSRAGFMPMASLVTGLPGETDDSILQAIRWAQSFRGERVTIFPVLYAPLKHDTQNAEPAPLTPLQWELFRASYGFNFEWIPRLFWRNQTVSGASLMMRCVTRILGRSQAILLGQKLRRKAKGRTQ